MKQGALPSFSRGRGREPRSVCAGVEAAMFVVAKMADTLLTHWTDASIIKCVCTEFGDRGSSWTWSGQNSDVCVTVICVSVQSQLMFVFNPVVLAVSAMSPCALALFREWTVFRDTRIRMRKMDGFEWTVCTVSPTRDWFGFQMSEDRRPRAQRSDPDEPNSRSSVDKSYI